MPSGLRLDTDPWHQDYEHSKHLAQEITQVIQDRNLRHPEGGPEASRMTAAVRRKLGSLGTAIDALESQLGATTDVTTNEKNRRRDMIRSLRSQRSTLLESLKRDHAAANKRALIGDGGDRLGPPRETEQTAGLDNREMLSLQSQIMKKQDDELEQIEETVQSTKHVALAINEEVDLQVRLLDNLEEDVDVVHSRMRAAALKVKQVLTSSNECRWWCLVIVLVAALVVVLVFAFKSFLF